MSNDVPIKKILILAANPKGTDKLRLDEEARDIKEGLRQSRERDRFIIDSEWAVRPRDIRRVVLYSKPQIVHFSGHGLEDGGLAFENAAGQVQLVQPEALAGLFKLFSEHVECVLLNACYSEIQANAISEHIDFVVGMNKEIGDRAAIEFAVGFYDALGAGCSIKTAYEFGCNAIQIAGISEHLTPTLKCKNSSLKSISAGLLEKTTSIKDPTTGSIKLETPSKITYEFVLTGSVNEISKKKLEAIVTHLQNITGDTSLTLIRVEAGSIKLILEGSEDGFREIEKVFKLGQLSKIENIAIEDVRMLDLQSTSSSPSTQSLRSSGEPSEPSLQDVLEASVDGVLILTEQGEILHINNTALQLLELLSSKTPKDVPVPPEIQHIYQALIDGSNLSSNRAITVESEISLENSYRIRIKAQWVKLKNDKNIKILMILQDERCSIRELVLEEAQQYGLTGRETEVWLLYRSENYTFRQIASELFITAGTVKKHIKNIYYKIFSKVEKSDLRSVAEEVALQEAQRTEQLMTELRGVAGGLTVQMQRTVDSR